MRTFSLAAFSMSLTCLAIIFFLISGIEYSVTGQSQDAWIRPHLTILDIGVPSRLRVHPLVDFAIAFEAFSGVFFPGQRFMAGRDFFHRDAVLDRADDGAQVAAD